MKAFYNPGRYQCAVTEHGFETSKSGKPMIVFRVLVTGELHYQTGDDGEPFQELIPVAAAYPRTVRLVIVEDNQDSLDYAMAKLRFAGFEGSNLEELDLQGLEIACDCTHQLYKGEQSEQWDLPLPSRTRTPLENDPSVARKMNAIFGRRLTATGDESTTAALPPPPAQVAAGVDDDSDIPF